MNISVKSLSITTLYPVLVNTRASPYFCIFTPAFFYHVILLSVMALWISFDSLSALPMAVMNSSNAAESFSILLTFANVSL